MVNWIGKIALLLKRLKDSWIDMLPMSALSDGAKNKPTSCRRGSGEY